MHKNRAIALSLVVGLVVLGSCLASDTRADDQASKLNVVFIIADDLGWGELGCFGQKKFTTPNIDSLAEQGMRLTQHYSGAPVCAPSRCVLMTGKHLGHAEIRGNFQAKRAFPQFDEGQYPISPSATTIAQMFQRAGYATGAMGKWGLGPVGSTGEPNKKGFDLFFGYNCQGVAHSYYPPYLWRNQEKITLNAKPVSGHQKKPEGEVTLDEWLGEHYAPRHMADEAVKFIENNRDRAFFLYLPFIEPHVAMHPPKETVEKFPVEWDPIVYRGESGYIPHPRPRAGYAAMITELDQHVGRVLRALEQHRLVDKTLVVFTSDNGTTHAGPPNTRFHIGGADPAFFNSTNGLRGYKGSVYEGGLRVPTIVRAPGRIPSNSVNDSASYFADWFPTLCEAAGLTKPEGLDGISLWSSVTSGQRIEQRPPMVWVFPEYGGQLAVRIGQYKIVRQKLSGKNPSEWEVFDIAKDRNETTNLAASRRDLIEQAIGILKDQVSENSVFPMKLPTDIPPSATN